MQFWVAGVYPDSGGGRPVILSLSLVPSGRLISNCSPRRFLPGTSRRQALSSFLKRAGERDRTCLKILGLLTPPQIRTPLSTNFAPHFPVRRETATSSAG